MKKYNLVPIVTDEFLDKHQDNLTDHLIASLIKQLCAELKTTNDYESIDELYAELGYVYELTPTDLALLNISGTSDLQEFVVRNNFL